MTCVNEEMQEVVRMSTSFGRCYCSYHRVYLEGEQLEAVFMLSCPEG